MFLIGILKYEYEYIGVSSNIIILLHLFEILLIGGIIILFKVVLFYVSYPNFSFRIFFLFLMCNKLFNNNTITKHAA